MTPPETTARFFDSADRQIVDRLMEVLEALFTGHQLQKKSGLRVPELPGHSSRSLAD